MIYISLASRCSMQNLILTYYRLRKREHLKALSSRLVERGEVKEVVL